VVTDGSAANSKLEPLGFLYAEPFGAEIHDDVSAAVSHDGIPYAIPLDIHRNNSLFYNAEVLAEHGVSVPTTLAELHAACETLALAEVPCLSVGGKEPWTLALLTWENLLVATAGPDYQQEFMHGMRGSSDPEIEELADELLLLWSYAHPSSASDGWVTAVERLGRGEVAMTVMGDWAKGLLVQQGLEPGTDFGQTAFPGTEGIFVFTADSFSLPRGAVSRAGAIELLRTLASPDGQLAFNRIKGSIPTRSDVDDDELDVLGRQTMAEFGAADRRMLAEADRFAVMQPFLRETVTSGDPELFVHAVRDLYDVLQ
jgi:glucose/mannose transport system substrate-binding protein